MYSQLKLRFRENIENPVLDTNIDDFRGFLWILIGINGFENPPKMLCRNSKSILITNSHVDL